MDPSTLVIPGLILLGVLVGCASALMGVGGGIFVIPSLMFIFGFSQLKANGTSLAMMLPPIGIFAVLSYSRAGNIDWKAAMLLATGFALGAYLGSRVLNRGLINPQTLRTGFAVVLVFCAYRILPRSADGKTLSLHAAFWMLAAACLMLVGRLRGKTTPNAVSTPPPPQAGPDAYDYDI